MHLDHIIWLKDISTLGFSTMNSSTINFPTLNFSTPNIFAVHRGKWIHKSTKYEKTTAIVVLFVSKHMVLTPQFPRETRKRQNPESIVQKYDQDL